MMRVANNTSWKPGSLIVSLLPTMLIVALLWWCITYQPEGILNFWRNRSVDARVTLFMTLITLVGFITYLVTTWRMRSDQVQELASLTMTHSTLLDSREAEHLTLLESKNAEHAKLLESKEAEHLAAITIAAEKAKHTLEEAILDSHNQGKEEGEEIGYVKGVEEGRKLAEGTPAIISAESLPVPIKIGHLWKLEGRISREDKGVSDIYEISKVNEEEGENLIVRSDKDLHGLFCFTGAEGEYEMYTFSEEEAKAIMILQKTTPINVKKVVEIF